MIKIDFNPKDTVELAIAKIESITGSSSNWQLFYEGRILKSGTTLADYDI